jgi:hypothetical protein
MRPKLVHDPLQDELTMALGLVWGHLNCLQLDAAYQLALGCLQLWPGERRLSLMAVYAAAELAEPVDLAALGGPAGADPARAAHEQAWIALVARRAGMAV